MVTNHWLYKLFAVIVKLAVNVMDSNKEHRDILFSRAKLPLGSPVIPALDRSLNLSKVPWKWHLEAFERDSCFIYPSTSLRSTVIGAIVWLRRCCQLLRPFWALRALGYIITGKTYKTLPQKWQVTISWNDNPSR